jgi:hypothetical protein
MARDGITEADLADLMRRCQDAAAALIRGDVGSYLGLFVHADDCTLLPPFGGAPRHGFDASEKAVEQLSRFFARSRDPIRICSVSAHAGRTRGLLPAGSPSIEK